MVSALSRSWAVRGDSRSLAERWAETSAQIVALGGTVSGPMLETTLQDMQAEVRRRTPAPEWDAALAGGQREFWQVIRRHQILSDELAQRRLRLLQLRDSDAHKVLNDIPPALLEAPPDTQSMIDGLFGRQQPRHLPVPGEINAPQFSTVAEYRQASRMVLAEVQKLDDMRARMDAVLHFENMGGEEKAMRLIFALASRVGALEDRIVELGSYQSVITNRKQRRAK
jgi:hypothetical protein